MAQEVSITEAQARRIVGDQAGVAFALISMFPDDLTGVEYDRADKRWRLTFIDEQAEIVWRLRWWS